jgi:hypothetical protein
VLPDTDGAIAEVLLHYDATLEHSLQPVHRDLFAALADDIRVLVVCPSFRSMTGFLQDWGDAAVGGGRDVYLINVGREVSPWARDRRIARHLPTDNTTSASIVPHDHTDYLGWQRNELTLASLLESTELACGVLNASLCIEGGNVVANGRHVFVGLDDLLRQFALDELATELTRLLGGEVVLLGASIGEAPVYHADMYVTPIDDCHVLVASPEFGLSLLDASESCEGSSFAEIAERGLSLQPLLDAVATQLADLDYNVLRMPAVVDEAGEWMITYNNVLMEEREGDRVVYMPVYDAPPLDLVAGAIYRSFGFEVRTIDVSRIYQRGGAVRCLVNVTRRRFGPGAPELAPSAEHRPIHVLDLVRPPQRRRGLSNAVKDLPHRTGVR